MTDSIVAWFGEIFQSGLDFFYRIYLSMIDFFRDFFWWILDSTMQLVIELLNSISLSFDVISPLQYIDAIPEGTKYFMAAVGFNESCGMIIAALTIKFVMRLIPFIRIGG